MGKQELTEFVRGLNDAPNNVGTPQNSVRKILFLTANPIIKDRNGEEVPLLRLGEELRKVKDGLSAATNRENFELISESAVMCRLKCLLC